MSTDTSDRELLEMAAKAARWREIATDGPPEPEVYVLCWDGQCTFVDWFGSKRDAGRGVTHWMPYPMPPGCKNDMHDGSRAAAEIGRQMP